MTLQVNAQSSIESPSGTQQVDRARCSHEALPWLRIPAGATALRETLLQAAVHKHLRQAILREADSSASRTCSDTKQPRTGVTHAALMPVYAYGTALGAPTCFRACLVLQLQESPNVFQPDANTNIQTVWPEMLLWLL